MSSDKASSQITFEIEQISKLLKSYKDLIALCQEGEPNLIDITAAASVLHSFYNGIENIFLSVSKNIDQAISSAPNWHSELLNEMAKKTEKRNFVISEDLKKTLTDYLGFRHFYRHSYSFQLEWGELKELVCVIMDVWKQIRKELSDFLESLKGQGN